MFFVFFGVENGNFREFVLVWMKDFGIICCDVCIWEVGVNEVKNKIWLN